MISPADRSVLLSQSILAGTHSHLCDPADHLQAVNRSTRPIADRDRTETCCCVVTVSRRRILPRYIDAEISGASEPPMTSQSS